MKKLRIVVLAAAALTMATGAAMAQATPTVPSQAGAAKKDTMTPAGAAEQTQKENKSPASTDAGARQEK